MDIQSEYIQKFMSEATSKNEDFFTKLAMDFGKEVPKKISIFEYEKEATSCNYQYYALVNSKRVVLQLSFESDGKDIEFIIRAWSSNKELDTKVKKNLDYNAFKVVYSKSSSSYSASDIPTALKKVEDFVSDNITKELENSKDESLDQQDHKAFAEYKNKTQQVMYDLFDLLNANATKGLINPKMASDFSDARDHMLKTLQAISNNM